MTEKNTTEYQPEDPASESRCLAVVGRMILKTDLKDIHCEGVCLTELACKEV